MVRVAVLTAGGMGPTSLVGAPQNLRQGPTELSMAGPGVVVVSHRGAAALLDTGSHGRCLL